MTIALFSLGISQAVRPGVRAGADRMSGKALERQFGLPMVISFKLYT